MSHSTQLRKLNIALVNLLIVLLALMGLLFAQYGQAEDPPAPQVAAAGAPCAAAVKELLEDASLTALAAESPFFAHLPPLYTQYKEMTAAAPDLAQLLPQAKVLELLSDPVMFLYPKVLGEVLNRVKADVTEATASQKFLNHLKEVLKNQVPASTIESRIAHLQHEANIRNLRRAFGDMEFSEVKMLYYGADFRTPSPDSLLGQYLAESGAKTLVRTFRLSPRTEEQGPPRLVVALSAASFESYKKFFTRYDMVSIIGHAHMIQNSKLTSYNYRFSEMRLPSPGNILPGVLLKTTEGQRMDQFFRLIQKSAGGNGNWNNPVMMPWTLDNYCATGAFVNCTHWIGNMPIGDDLVTQYILPGATDGYASNHISKNPIVDAAPRVRELIAHKSADPLMQRVYRVPGNKQFSDVLGQSEGNGRGDFANPGWVIQTLIGPTTNDRVPVVFYIVPDHQSPIRENFVPEFEAPL